MDVLIRTRVHNVHRFVRLQREELNKIDVFLTKALMKHGISTQDSVDIELYDRHGTPIEQDDFTLVIEQYRQFEDFCIVIDINTKGAFTFSSESLKNYLREHNCKAFMEEEARNKFLSQQSIKTIVYRLRDYVETMYSASPTNGELIEVCNMAVEIFPSLKVKDSKTGGIDILFNPDGRNGLLREKFIYKQRSKSETRKSTVDLRAIDDIDIEELAEFFKKCVLPRDEKPVKEKLKDTAVARKIFLENNEKTILESCFNLYLVSPAMVLVDFKNMYSDINEKALEEIWPKMETIPAKMFNSYLDSSVQAYHEDKNVYNFLSFMKLFPTHKTKFESSVDALIVFCDDPKKDPTTLRTKNESPYIIMIYTSEPDQPKQFYICFERYLFNAPSHDFIEAMDFFVKLHKVFNVKYHKALNQIMIFVDKHIYIQRLRV